MLCMINRPGNCTHTSGASLDLDRLLPSCKSQARHSMARRTSLLQSDKHHEAAPPTDQSLRGRTTSKESFPTAQLPARLQRGLFVPQCKGVSGQEQHADFGYRRRQHQATWPHTGGRRVMAQQEKRQTCMAAMRTAAVSSSLTRRINSLMTRLLVASTLKEHALSQNHTTSRPGSARNRLHLFADADANLCICIRAKSNSFLEDC